MGKQIVHVNGKAYDAVTGRRIDDIIAPKQAGKRTPSTPPVAVSASQRKPKPAKTKAARDSNHLKAHQPQHAVTLMRHGVKQPKASLKKQLRPQHELARGNAQAITVKHTAEAVDPDRQQRAEQIEKNHHVRRFHSPEPVKITLAEVPVQHSPQDVPDDEPPAAPPPLPTNKPGDMFEQAIENASHYVDLAARKAHLKKKARRHLLSMSAGTLALFLIAGFAAYQNTPGLQIKVAGIRAGVTTTTPNFAAGGFAYSGTRAEQSRLIIGLKSGTATYQLSEQATNWSGQEMIDHISSIDASGNPNYNTVETSSGEVYRLDSGQATWVKNGVWYHVHSDKAVSDDQLRTLVQNT